MQMLVYLFPPHPRRTAIPKILVVTFSSLHILIMKDEVNVSRSSSVRSHKFFVSNRSLVLLVASKHALYAQARGLHVLDGRPALRAEQIETYDAIRVDVWVHWYLSAWWTHKYYLRRFYRVI